MSPPKDTEIHNTYTIHDIDAITTGEAVELRMCRLIRENTMQSCFPNMEAVTNKECTANDDRARTPKHADIDEYRERVSTHD